MTTSSTIAMDWEPSVIGAPNHQPGSLPSSRSNTTGSSKSDCTGAHLLKGTGAIFDKPFSDEGDSAAPRPVRRSSNPAEPQALSCRLEPLPGSPREQPVYCDIILVHGLSGDETSTWQCGSMFWPRELSREYPHARILSFACDRNLWTQDGMHMMEEVVRQLISKLVEIRPRESPTCRRPIIWIAHSLGGWLVKAALALARNSPRHPSLGVISESSKAVVFFGTPHRTRTIIGCNNIVRRIKAASQNTSEFDVTESTVDDEEPKILFMTLLSAFEASLNDGHLAVYSFFERHETSTDSIAALVTSGENALNHAYEKLDYLDGNHITMCQFPTTSERGYEEISKLVSKISSRPTTVLSPGFHNHLSTVTQIMSGIPPSDLEKFLVNLQDNRVQREDSDDYETIATQIAHLFLPTVKLRRVKRILTAPVFGLEYVQSLLANPESIEWICKSEDSGFSEWINKEKFLLVISGPIGAGKSAAAHQIASYLEQVFGSKAKQATDRDDIVLHHFFNRQSDPEARVTEMIHQFLLQILEIHPSLVRHFPTSKIFARPQRRQRWPYPDLFYDLYSPPKRTPSGIEVRQMQVKHDLVPLFSDEELMEIMLSMLRANPVTQTSIVIDGVDECDKSSQNLIWELIKQLRTIPNAMVCLTSSPDSLLLHNLEDFQVDTVSIDITSRPEYQSGVLSFADSQLKSLERRLAVERRIVLPLESAKKIHKLFSGEVPLSYLWIKLARRVMEGIRNLPYLVEFIDFLVPDIDDLGRTPNIHDLNMKIIEILVSYRDRFAVLALIFVALANRPLKPTELSILLATSQSLPRYPTTPTDLTLKSLPRPILQRPLPSDKALRSPRLSPQLPRPLTSHRMDFWKWLNVNPDLDSAKQLTLREVELEQRLDLEKWLNGELFDLLTFQGGVVSLAHPSFKDAIVSFIRPKYPDRFMRLQRELATACLTTLCLPGRSGITFEFDDETRAHKPPVDQYSYALKNWDKHLNEAGWEGPAIHPLVRELWQDQQFRDPILQLSGKKFPNNLRMDEFCLYASLNVQYMLNIYSWDGSEEIPLPLVCAVANASIESCQTLIGRLKKQKCDTAWVLLSPKLSTLAERTNDGTFFRKWKKLVNDNTKTDSKSSNAPPDTDSLEGTGLEVTEAKRDIKRAIARYDENGIVQLIQKYRGKGSLFGEMKLEGLQLAIRHCNAQIVRLLLDSGADVNAVLSDSGASMLHLGASTGDLDMVRLLVEYRARKSATDVKGMKPIHWAAERGHSRIVEYLLTSSLDKDRFGQTPLFNACSCGSLSTIRILLDYGLSINMKDEAGRTPLHIAASTGAKNTVRLLLIEGANPNAKDKDGFAPLQIAAYGGWETVVTELLAAAASVDAQSVKGQSALHLACKSSNPALEVVKALLDAGADANKADNIGRKPLLLAVKYGSIQMVTVLLKKTSFENQASKDDFLLAAMKYKEKKPENINILLSFLESCDTS